jgi:hypothetical protein
MVFLIEFSSLIMFPKELKTSFPTQCTGTGSVAVSGGNIIHLSCARTSMLGGSWKYNNTNNYPIGFSSS